MSILAVPISVVNCSLTLHIVSESVFCILCTVKSVAFAVHSVLHALPRMLFEVQPHVDWVVREFTQVVGAGNMRPWSEVRGSGGC